MCKRTSLAGLSLILLLAGAPLAAPALGQPKDTPRYAELLQTRLATVRQLVQVTTTEYQAGNGTYERVHQAKELLLHAKLEVSKSEKERLAVLEEAVAVEKQFEQYTEERHKAGKASQSDVLLATVARLEAEIALDRARALGQPKAPAGPK